MIRDQLGLEIAVPSDGSTAPPRVGDVWLVGHDGIDTGVVLVAAVRESHVMAWPVLGDAQDATAPAFRVTIPEAGRVTVWPEAEFGLTMASLSRKIAESHDDRTLNTIRWHVRGQDEMPDVVDACPPRSARPEMLDVLSAACDAAWVIGDWAWPSSSVGRALLNEDLLKRYGVSTRDVADRLQVERWVAGDLVAGEAIPTTDQVAVLREMLPDDLDEDDLVTPITGEDANVSRDAQVQAEGGNAPGGHSVARVRGAQLGMVPHATRGTTNWA